MAIPLTPIAALVLRYGAVAVAGYAAARMLPSGRLPDAVETEMDRAPRGFRLRQAREQISGSARIVRDWRLGRLGPRFRIDATALARVTLKRVG